MTREEAIYNLHAIKDKYTWSTGADELVYMANEALDMAIKALEQELKTGQWIDTENYYQRWKCSECGCHTRDATPSFCPNCGTKMIEPPKSEEVVR